jgi:predicted site-specific integrase-resolvase
VRQERDGKLARQTARLQKATTARGDEVAAVISEHALSLNEKRKGMKKLLGLLKEQEVEGVFIADPNLLVRSDFG